MNRSKARRRGLRSAVDQLEARRLLSTITVAPSGAQFSDIQQAIDSASNGDTISIAPGTYNASPIAYLGNEQLIFIRKGLTIEGTGANL